MPADCSEDSAADTQTSFSTNQDEYPERTETNEKSPAFFCATHFSPAAIQSPSSPAPWSWLATIFARY